MQSQAAPIHQTLASCLGRSAAKKASELGLKVSYGYVYYVFQTYDHCLQFLFPPSFPNSAHTSIGFPCTVRMWNINASMPWIFPFIFVLIKYWFINDLTGQTVGENKSCTRLWRCYKIFTPEVFVNIYRDII